MGNQHGEEPVNDDSRKIEQNQINDCKMEENCVKRNTGQSQIPSEFHWITKLPSAQNQEKLTPNEETKQSQDLDSTIEGLEQRTVPQSQYITGNLLVESRSGQKQTNISNNCFTTSDSIKRCIKEQLGCMPEASESRRTDSLPGRLGQVQSLNIESNNSSAAFNINRGAAATALAKLVDRTPEKAEKLNIQQHAFHIPGLQNKILDLLSRLATSGDYTIDQEILNEALHILKVRPTALFYNGRNVRETAPPIPLYFGGCRLHVPFFSFVTEAL
ncbi:MAG: hypothetical protein EZS28_049132 [Streblomastix strix]|uniref:Uncharacterized protein n=1 Tax=Streblomastix strix TaxID=222440 RepID=A0A5J4TCF5_9EUKA|nr:MAG: hypothetical protein EZS28_049132 [Streblomastix strix]